MMASEKALAIKRAQEAQGVLERLGRIEEKLDRLLAAQTPVHSMPAVPDALAVRTVRKPK